MKIEVGKRYRTRGGDEVRMNKIHDTPGWAYVVDGDLVCTEVQEKTWTREGFYYGKDEPSESDIVEEIIEDSGDKVVTEPQVVVHLSGDRQVLLSVRESEEGVVRLHGRRDEIVVVSERTIAAGVGEG